jgi:hypothetical protein
MAEPKPLASLTSGLLARKGSALPAMRRQSISGFGGGYTGGVNDDLGWNDMGHDHGGHDHSASADILPLAGLTPMAHAPIAVEPTPVPQVVTDRVDLAERVAAVAQPRISAASVGRKAAFTLRLDADRHLKLRLLCAVQGRSAQQVVSEALDIFIKGQPEIDRLAEQLPPARGKH